MKEEEKKVRNIVISIVVDVLIILVATCKIIVGPNLSSPTQKSNYIVLYVIIALGVFLIVQFVRLAIYYNK